MVLRTQSEDLQRIFLLCRDDPENAEGYRLEAFESCPGLSELWRSPFRQSSRRRTARCSSDSRPARTAVSRWPQTWSIRKAVAGESVRQTPGAFCFATRPTLAHVPLESSPLGIRPTRCQSRRKPNRPAPRKEAGLPRGWGSADLKAVARPASGKGGLQPPARCRRGSRAACTRRGFPGSSLLSGDAAG